MESLARQARLKFRRLWGGPPARGVHCEPTGVPHHAKPAGHWLRNRLILHFLKGWEHTAGASCQTLRCLCERRRE